jgi:hypothetical protein
VRVADFAFGAHDALGEGGSGEQESASDFFGREAADFAQREGDARIGRERGMAAGED